MTNSLTDPQRRVLGFLPVWRDAEGLAMVAAEMQRKEDERNVVIQERISSDEHPETELPAEAHYVPYPTGFTVDELRERSDCPAELFDESLAYLQDQGLVANDEGTVTMTESGYAALTA